MTLQQSLRSLGTDDKMEVPHHVNVAVMAAWDASRVDAATDRAQSGSRSPMWVATCAAVIVACTVLLMWRPLQDGPGAPTVRPESSVRIAPSLPTTAHIPATSEVAKPQRLPAHDTAAPRAAARPTRGADTAYVLVPELEAGGPLTLMRVRMARRAFSRLGVPISNPDGDGLVDVEVLVGEDGVARSIRRAVAVGWTGANP